MSIYADIKTKQNSSLPNKLIAEPVKSGSANISRSPVNVTEKLNIGLFGFGCVGQGLYDVLNHSQSLKAEIRKICVKDKLKQRSIEKRYFTYEKTDVLKNIEHDLIVELIDDAEAALEITTEALLKGKSVVSANKKMLAENFKLLYNLQRETAAAVLYEGACAASIPIIRTLEEYYDNELLRGVRGILNGSSNYILTKMETGGLTFESALKQAQELGFAESNPELDICGYDSKYKLCLLAAHAFGLILKPDDILNLGIENITPFDLNFAKTRDSRVKLVAVCEKSEKGYRVYVLPCFVNKAEPLGTVNYENNGIEVEGVYSDKQFFTGKGAGSHPTGSAVLSDISAITYDYRYGYRKLKNREKNINGSANDQDLIDNEFIIKLYIRYESKESLEHLEIENVTEEHKSIHGSYIIADCRFSSLYNVYRKKDEGIFISVIQ